MAATQEYVTTRLFPTEQEVSNLKTTVEELRALLQSRDADWQNAERRIEEVYRIVEELEKERKSEGPSAKSSSPFDEGTDRDAGKPNSLLRNPAFRQVDCYTGEHKR